MVLADEPCVEGEGTEVEEEKFEDGVSTQALEIDFKTKMKDAVLVTVVYRPKTATLQIQNGTLRYSIHHNERLLFEVVNDISSVSDDRWHRASLDVAPNGRAIRLSLDGHHRSAHSGFSYPQFVSAAVDSISLGGGFSGCLKRFVVFDQSQPLINRLDARLDSLQYLENVGRSGGPVSPGCDCDRGDVEFFQASVFPVFLFAAALLLLVVFLVLVGILLWRRMAQSEPKKPKRVTTDCVRTIDSLFRNQDIGNYNDAFDILSTTTTHRADSLPHIYEVPPEPPAMRRHKQPKMGTSPLNTVTSHRHSARELKQAVRESVASARNAAIPLSTSESETESYRTRSRSRRSRRRVPPSTPSGPATTPADSDGYDAVVDGDYMRPRRSARPVSQEHCRVQYL
uniref:LAM_G_DOMAIN domain-containing protein n=1 Tax=Steinernema glaseri TaxID=37863 RepID=A0A1I7Z6S1_9BILA